MIFIFPRISHVALSLFVYTALTTPLDCKYLEGGKSMSFFFLSLNVLQWRPQTHQTCMCIHTCARKHTHTHLELTEQIDKSMLKNMLFLTKFTVK